MGLLVKKLFNNNKLHDFYKVNSEELDCAKNVCCMFATHFAILSAMLTRLASYSPTTSTPLGGVNKNVESCNMGLRSTSLKSWR